MLLVGDDTAGYHFGFLTGSTPWQFIEFDHCDLDRIQPSDHPGLLQFLVDELLHTEDGAA